MAIFTLLPVGWGWSKQLRATPLRSSYHVRRCASRALCGVPSQWQHLCGGIQFENTAHLCVPQADRFEGGAHHLPADSSVQEDEASQGFYLLYGLDPCRRPYGHRI
uniref:Uncharacterized protein n=1 Tax=Cacopsylla melanoneura TaxID=428564 RepID=A0A8D9B3U2_9HEMI